MLSYNGSLSNTCLTLYPAFALVSMNITFSSLAFFSPSSVDTCLSQHEQANNQKKTYVACSNQHTQWLQKQSKVIESNHINVIVTISISKTNLLSVRSVLLPTSIIMTSPPRSVLTSSIHLDVCWNELASEYIDIHTQIPTAWITDILMHN